MTVPSALPPEKPRVNSSKRTVTPPKSNSKSSRTPPVTPLDLKAVAEKELAHERLQSQTRLKSTWESIFIKYGRNFDGTADEIDPMTGEIVVDNGHIRGMQDESEEGEDGFGWGDIAVEKQQGKKRKRVHTEEDDGGDAGTDTGARKAPKVIVNKERTTSDAQVQAIVENTGCAHCRDKDELDDSICKHCSPSKSTTTKPQKLPLHLSEDEDELASPCSMFNRRPSQLRQDSPVPFKNQTPGKPTIQRPSKSNKSKATKTPISGARLATTNVLPSSPTPATFLISSPQIRHAPPKKASSAVNATATPRTSLPQVIQTDDDVDELSLPTPRVLSNSVFRSADSNGKPATRFNETAALKTTKKQPKTSSSKKPPPPAAPNLWSVPPPGSDDPDPWAVPVSDTEDSVNGRPASDIWGPPPPESDPFYNPIWNDQHPDGTPLKFPARPQDPLFTTPLVSSRLRGNSTSTSTSIKLRSTSKRLDASTPRRKMEPLPVKTPGWTREGIFTQHKKNGVRFLDFVEGNIEAEENDKKSSAEGMEKVNEQFIVVSASTEHQPEKKNDPEFVDGESSSGVAAMPHSNLENSGVDTAKDTTIEGENIQADDLNVNGRDGSAVVIPAGGVTDQKLETPTSHEMPNRLLTAVPIPTESNNEDLGNATSGAPKESEVQVNGTSDLQTVEIELISKHQEVNSQPSETEKNEATREDPKETQGIDIATPVEKMQETVKVNGVDTLHYEDGVVNHNEEFVIKKCGDKGYRCKKNFCFDCLEPDNDDEEIL